LLSLLLSLGLTACSAGQPSAVSLANDAVRAFDRAPVKTIQGSFVDGVIPVSVEVTVDSKGDASGTGTFDHFPVAFLRTGGDTFIQGVAYWHWERLFQWSAWPQLGQQWVQTGPDPATSAFEVASRAAGTLAEMKHNARSMSVESPVRREGRWVYPISYGATTYEVSADKSRRLVAVQDSTPRAGVNLLTRTKLSISYGGVLHAAAPGTGEFVDLGDPTTLPALYTDLGDVAPAQCDETGCTLTEKIGNNAGAPVGQSVLTITYYEDVGHVGPLASCQAAIPAIPHNGSAQVSCRATGSALVSWTSQYGYLWDTSITNPPYDP